jgi:hypothetical protein
MRGTGATPRSGCTLTLGPLHAMVRARPSAPSIALGRFLCMAPCRTSAGVERLTLAGPSVHAVPVLDPKVREDDGREGQPE